MNIIKVLNSPISQLTGVGPKTTKSLNKKNIKSIKDLINWFPKKFIDTRKIYSISEIYKLFDKKNSLLSNFVGITKPVYGQIIEIKLFTTPKKKLKILKLKVQDLRTQDKIIIDYFNQPYLAKIFQTNQKYIFFGKILKKGSTAYLTNPNYEKYSNKLYKFGKITPVYINKSKYITNNKLRRLLYQTIPIIENIREFIPEKLIIKNQITTIEKAYLSIHFPQTTKDLLKSVKRLQIQELLELLEQEKKLKQEKTYTLPKLESSYIVQELQKITKNLKNKLNFSLTKHQTKIINNMAKSLTEENQNLFLYGDVGAGKTIIFLILAILFLEKEYNVILIAPTKILASQHYKKTKSILNKLNYNFKIKLADKLSQNDKRDSLKSTLIIGTTKLLFLNKQYKINNVGLIGIDEEHKFGVKHRQELIKKYTKEISPYIISMSATPIPRTLARNFYGFNKSFYLTSTPFPKNIITRLTNFNNINKVFTWLKKQLLNNTQAYIVFPRIISENYEINIENFSPIIKKWLAPLHIEILHGLIPQHDQTQITQNFRQNKIKALISTSLIEVGIDSPNASIIIILGAEMFGLAQLHQLRGRIGRRGQESYCILIPSNSTSEKNLKRLQLFTKIKDGLELAKLDLKLRGPGTVIAGNLQTGLNKTKIANLYDYATIKKVVKIYETLKTKQINIPRIIT